MKNKSFLTLLLLLLLIPRFSYSWWNSSWSYRRCVKINENSNTSLINYPINLTLDTKTLIIEKKVNIDCSDIRVIEWVAERNFSIVGCDSHHTTLMFKVNITSLETKSDICIYYGNVLAFSKNVSLNNIFYEWFDDFSTNTSLKYDAVEGNWRWDNVNKWIVGRGYNAAPTPDTVAYRYLVRNKNVTGGILEGKIYLASTETQQGKYVDTGFTFLMKDEFNGYSLRVQKNGLPTRSKWKVQKIVNGDAVEVICSGVLDTFFPFREWFNIKLVFNQTCVSAYKDGILFGNCSYPYSSSGTFGLYMDRGGDAYFDDLRIRKYVYPEPTVILGPEETFQPFFVSITTKGYTFTAQPFTILTNIKYNNSFLTSLTQDNFLLTLENNPLPIQRFKNYGNGTYELVAMASSHNLGKKTLTINVNYDNTAVQNSTKILLLTKPTERVLIITNPDWKNYIPAVTTNKPTLVYNQTRKFIDYFISYYKPEQIFQLGTDLTFQQETYNVDSADALLALFLNKTDIVVTKNKEIAIASAMLDLPIAYELSQEVLKYLNPNTVYKFENVEEVENLFLQKKDSINYLVLTNPNDIKSMFAASLARSAFVIQSKLDAEQTKNLLKQKVSKLSFQTDDYSFNLTAFLTLIGVPYFNVTDPVKETWNDYDGNNLLTDTPYADINDDGYLDLAVGRLEGNVEQVSYQLELKKIFKPKKRALILAAYNTPGKYFDVMTAGGTMQDVINIELDLYLKGFKITRLVERRSEFDTLDMSFIEKLRKLASEFGALDEASYTSFFSLLINGLRQIIVVLRAGETILYAMNEFDWIDAWQSIVNLEPHYPRHLPELTVSNMLPHTMNNSIVIYMSKGNESHWFIPTKGNPDIKLCTLFEYEEFCTNYTVFDPTRLEFNPDFYYVHHSKGFYNYKKILEKGTLAFIGSTGATHNLYSARTAREFFRNFEKPVGKSLAMVKNWNYEISKLFSKQKVKIEDPNVYLKEYYTKNLLGEPSLLLDPSLELKKSEDIQIQQGKMKITFKIKPSYNLITENSRKILYFKKPDSFLLVYNKPIVPLYKKSFLLPTNAEILDVSIDIKTRKEYENVTLPTLLPDPEFYDIVTSFDGTFPTEFYWNGSYKLLDGRLAYDFLFSPVVYSSNNSGVVFEEIEVSFQYKAPIEITSVSCKNVTIGEATRIVVNAYNSYASSIEASYLVKIDSEDSSKLVENKISLKPGKNSFYLDFKPEQIMNYSVSVIVRYNDITAGPKYTWFSVLERKKKPLLYGIKKFFENFFKIFQQIITPRERIKVERTKNELVLEYTTQNESFRVEMKERNLFAYLILPDRKFVFNQTPNSKVFKLYHNAGIYVLEKRGDETKELVDGDVNKLKQLFYETSKIFEQKLSKFKEYF